MAGSICRKGTAKNNQSRKSEAKEHEKNPRLRAAKFYVFRDFPKGRYIQEKRGD